MKIQITIEVEVSEPQEWQKGMTPTERWLCDYDLECQVDEGFIKVISSEEVV